MHSQNSSKDRIVILTYHRLYRDNDPGESADPAEAFYAISGQVFEEHLKYLQINNFKSVHFEEFLNGESITDQRSVILTFDDGQISDLEIALPLLVQYGFKGIFFMCVDFIGKAGYMNWAEINTLAEAGMSVECHGLLHRDYSLLTEDEAMHELLAARRCLERNLGREVRYLAMPGGFVSHSAYAAGFSAGFKAICNSKQGIASRGKILKRFVLRRRTPQSEFEGLVTQDWKQRIASWMMHFFTSAMKNAMGVRRYESVKQRLWR